MKHLFARLLLASSIMASVAFAGPLDALFGASYSHDRLFANASMGVGRATFENADGEESLSADGFGMRFHGKLGFYFFQNFALHANMGYVMYSNFRDARYGLPVFVDHEFYVLSSVFVGAGVTYYVPEWSNMFFSGALGVTGYRIDNRRYYGTTGLRAFTFDVEMGKDWWVNEYITLGASIAFNSGDYWSNDDGVFRSSSIMLMFSVTLN